MNRPSINPRCPHCDVRHKAVDQWKCKERQEAEKLEVPSDRPTQVERVRCYSCDHEYAARPGRIDTACPVCGSDSFTHGCSSAESNARHVVPRDDLMVHNTSGDECTCGPTTESVMRDDGSNGWLITHHSLDGRETGCDES